MIEIRRLYANDFHLFKSMDRGLEEDYIANIFTKLTEGTNHLYGLFYYNQLAITAGFTIYQNKYAMVGRLRSDVQYRGMGLATKLIEFVIEKAFQLEEVIWVGANTEENNISAMNVLKRVGLKEQTILHGAITADPRPLANGEKQWNEITDLYRKKAWLHDQYIKSKKIFPYECYYPFPAADALFEDDEVARWRFFENDERSRFFLLKNDTKKYNYLHVVYPWNDIHKQEELWKTIELQFLDQKKRINDELYIWIDLTKNEAAQLPADHPFSLPVPWVLFGINRESYSKIKDMHRTSIKK